MAKQTSRRLWIEIKFYAPGVDKETVRQTLIESIRNGTYSYPKTWKVGLYWRNRFTAPMKSGEFRREMRASRESSPGFDIAILDYLRGM